MRLVRVLVTACGAVIGLSPTLSAQLVVGATAGAVKYDAQSTTTSFALNPEVRYERRGFVLDIGGGYTAGSDGGRAADGGGTIWGSTRPGASHVQLDGLLQASLTHPQADSSSSALFGLGEVAYAFEGRGIAVGLGTVQATIQGTPSVGALRTEVRGWYVLPDGDVTLTASVEPTRLAGSWFTEFAGGAEWTPGAWDISGGLRLREIPGSGATLGGAGSFSRDVTPRWAVELDLGRYLRDPYQGLPAGYFISLGVRLKLASWKTGTGEGVGAAGLGDVSLNAAARNFGFASHGNSGPGSGTGSGRTVSPGSGRGSGHKP